MTTTLQSTSLGLTEAGGGAEVSKNLAMTMEPQQQSNWCWSAVGTSVGLFFKTGSWTQCETADGCLDRTDCCPDPPACNVYGYVDKALAFTKSFDSKQSGTIGAPEIESQIDLGHPVAVRVAWNGGGAHFLTITGYSYPESDPADVTLTLEDSIYGTSTMALADFAEHYQSGGVWTHTYLTRPES